MVVYDVGITVDVDSDRKEVRKFKGGNRIYHSDNTLSLLFDLATTPATTSACDSTSCLDIQISDLGLDFSACSLSEEPTQEKPKATLF